VRGDAAIEQAGDARVAEGGQELAFGLKAAPEFIAASGAAHDLDGPTECSKRPVGARGQIHRRFMPPRPRRGTGAIGTKLLVGNLRSVRQGLAASSEFHGFTSLQQRPTSSSRAASGPTASASQWARSAGPSISIGLVKQRLDFFEGGIF